jgi:hypothetical protein
MKTVITACSIFFRSKAYRYVALLGAWQNFVVNQDKSVKVSERAVLLDDHTSVVKDGRKMPGVVSMPELPPVTMTTLSFNALMRFPLRSFRDR